MCITQTHDVVGMTCDHCVRAVKAEVGALPGVTEVAVDLTTGEVRITADGPVPDEPIRRAVEEAGYALA